MNKAATNRDFINRFHFINDIWLLLHIKYFLRVFRGDYLVTITLGVDVAMRDLLLRGRAQACDLHIEM